MSSFFKKFQLLKRKPVDSEETSSEQRKNEQEGPSQAHQPSSSHDPAARRTSLLLPLLIKPTTSATTEARKKPLQPPLVLPELRQPSRTGSDERRPHPPEKTKGASTLPKLPVKGAKTSSSPAGKKPLPSALEKPAQPEFADEKFRYIWDSKVLPRGRSLREAVEMLDEKDILDTILSHLQQMVQGSTIEPTIQVGRKRMGLLKEADSNHIAIMGQTKLQKASSKERFSLYRYYGSKLRDTKHKELVGESLHVLLEFSTQDEDSRVGASEAIGLAAFSHLREVLVALRDYGNMVYARKALHAVKMTEDTKNCDANQVRTTLILCYGHAAVGARPEDLTRLTETIITEIIAQFRGGHKDEVLKKTFLKAVVMVSKAFQNSQKEDVLFPHKAEVILCIIQVIDEEPLGSVCITVLHQAIMTVISMTLLKPPLDYEVRSDLVQKSVKKIFSLPALKMTRLKAGSTNHLAQTQDFYLQTINACNIMLTSLLSETPNMDGLQEILIHTNSWVESGNTNERERAVKSTTHILKFASEHLDFDLSQEFSLLGQLVALLALRTVDNVKEIGQQAAEAIYHLHYIAISKMVKDMESKRKNKKGHSVKWLREDFFIPGPSIFYNNIPKVAKAFGEHLTTSQITDLVLKVFDNLMHEEKVVSQAASLLLSSFMEECGMDLEDLPMIIGEIHSRLNNIRDAATKEETLKAIRNLASKRINGVVDCLLESSVECDSNAMELWKILMNDPYSSAKLLSPLLKRLQGEDPLSESGHRRNSKLFMPLAATNALRWILSLPEAFDVVQNKFPHLLLALCTQIYYALGSGRRGSKRSNNSEYMEPPSALGSAVQALKNLISCMGYIREYNILGMQGSWEKLQHPDTYFEAVFHLIRTLFTFSKWHLKVMFKQANAYLRHSEPKEKTVGMAFFTELLFHEDIGVLFVKQDILDVLREWMLQPGPLKQTFSIRGLGHLLQFPLEDENLEPLLPPLISCAFDSDRNIAKESIKTLRYMFRHLAVEDYGSTVVSLIPHLLKYFNDEDNEVRGDAIDLFGTLLKGAAISDGNRHSLKEDVLMCQVPLLIQLGDPFTREVSQDVLFTCTNFMKWGDVPSGLFVIENYANLSSAYVNICKYLLRKSKHKLPEMLALTMPYLKSKYACYREAAALLIGNYAPYMKGNGMNMKIEDTYLAVRELQSDSETTVSNAAIAAIEQLFQYCGNQISQHLIPHQLMRVFKSSQEKAKLEERK
ncbi:maestro heat-like repeat family member 5 [Heteronotia binoei]|uniref:maestro heat-like repeat family member 5 n=1 Tax=Heteronotia binoei TaxID=13085 RepID=UPI0029316944|nr:maestro heat-like repeat family member 5 [Heteronotia binoei]